MQRYRSRFQNTDQNCIQSEGENHSATMSGWRPSNRHQASPSSSDRVSSKSDKPANSFAVLLAIQRQRWNGTKTRMNCPSSITRWRTRMVLSRWKSSIVNQRTVANIVALHRTNTERMRLAVLLSLKVI